MRKGKKGGIRGIGAKGKRYRSKKIRKPEHQEELAIVFSIIALLVPDKRRGPLPSYMFSPLCICVGVSPTVASIHPVAAC